MITGFKFEAAPNYHSFDTPSVKSLYTDPKEPLRFQLYVKGMRCAKCVGKLEGIPFEDPQITSVRVSLGQGLAEVTVKGQDVKLSHVLKSINHKGFEAVPIAHQHEIYQQQRQEDRHDLIRLAVVGAIAGNIMSFAFSSYFGLRGSLETVFNWISFALYLPVLTYGAWPFYKGFLSSIKERKLSIDGPMALASVAGFTFSTVNLIRGEGSIYYDSLSGFLFLILLSRFFQKRLLRQYMEPLSGFGDLRLSKARVMIDGKWQWRAASEIHIGDQIYVENGEMLPADIELQISRAEFQLAHLSGESRPVLFTEGMRVPAGSFLLSASVQGKVTHVGLQTEFGRILKKVSEGAFRKVRIQNLSDRAATYLLASVFSIAALFLLAYWSIDPIEASERSLALIILACPCAMAFGTPLALSRGIKESLNASIIIKSADVFEKIKSIKNIFLDKTGTVTPFELKIIKSTPSLVDQDLAQIILSLESISSHPAAHALRRYFSNLKFSKKELEGLREIPGFGVIGYYAGNVYEMKSVETSAQSNKKIGLFQDGQLLVEFELSSQVLPNLHKTVKTLQDTGYNVFLLSGDKEKFVLETARELGLSPQNCFSELSPDQKAEVIAKHPNSMMVGDGVNDSIAFQGAELSVAVSGSMEVALKSADVVFLKEGLESIPHLQEISRRTRNLIYQNLMISLVYNLVGGVLALMGYINPFIAALLMPVSSGFILLSTYLGGKK